MSPEALAVLQQAKAIIGVVPNAGRTYAHRPDIARLIHTMYTTIVLSPASELGVGLKNKLAVICSSINGCVYCTSHQCSQAQKPVADGGRWGLGDDEVLGLISGCGEGGDEVERLCFEFARTASTSPGSVPVELLERLKLVLNPAAIVELGCVVSMWKFYNTMHDSLHIPPEAMMGKYAGVIDAGRAAAATV